MGFLIKPAAFGALILAGCLLRHKNILSSNDQKTFSRLVLNITLPAAVIHSFYGFEKEPSLYLMIAMGFLCSLLPFLAAYCLTGKLNRQDRMFTMVNIAGYNIGCFTLPLIQNFFGQTGSVAACMFDTGNAVMMTGGSYALVTTLLHLDTGDNGSVQTPVWKRFLGSIPFDTYMLMLVFSSIGIQIPGWLDALLEPVYQENSFLAMLMIGMMLRPVHGSAALRNTMRVILGRLAFACIFSLSIYHFAPLSLEMRQVLAVTVFAPVSTLAPIYTEKCKGDTAVSSFTASVSIVIGLFVMSGLAMWFRL